MGEACVISKATFRRLGIPSVELKSQKQFGIRATHNTATSVQYRRLGWLASSIFFCVRNLCWYIWPFESRCFVP